VITKPSPMVVACHDAGGTQQIIGLMHGLSLPVTHIVAQGPALKIIAQHRLQHLLITSLNDIPNATRTLISGTGWASNLEHDARLFARQTKLFSIAVLDHWVNFTERFERHGITQLPDEIWVVDAYAEQRARNLFPFVPIQRQSDFYLNKQIADIAPISKVTTNSLLYLCEPIRSTWNKNEAGEFQALRYFFTHIKKLSLPNDTTIRLRLHPSEPNDKYDALTREFGDFAITKDNADLATSLSQSRWVVGCQTYAMTVALAAGRTVYSTLPTWAPPCPLPHEGIIHLSHL
jgi:hypothetical protein